MVETVVSNEQIFNFTFKRVFFFLGQVIKLQWSREGFEQQHKGVTRLVAASGMTVITPPLSVIKYSNQRSPALWSSKGMLLRTRTMGYNAGSIIGQRGVFGNISNRCQPRSYEIWLYFDF